MFKLTLIILCKCEYAKVCNLTVIYEFYSLVLIYGSL